MTSHKAKLIDESPSTKHPIYSTWQGIKGRCYDQKPKEWEHYGIGCFDTIEEAVESKKKVI